MIELSGRGISRRILAAVLCALALPVAAAQPTKWKTCYFEGTGGIGLPLALIVIEPFEVVAEPKGPLVYPTAAFEQDPGVSSVVPGYTRFSSATYGCDAYDTREGAQARADRVKGWGSYSITRSVQWTPPASVTGLSGGARKSSVRQVSKPSASSPGPGATVVKADTSQREASQRWDAQARKALAEEAQNKIDAAVRDAKADAEAQAKIQAFLAERRRQGRAQ